MKRILFTALLINGLLMLNTRPVLAQQDSIKSLSNPKGRFVGGLTFTRFDIGFSRLIDHGNFSLLPHNDFLDYKALKTSTVSFDLFDYGYRFNTNFKVYVAAGFDWTMIRLRKDITIRKNTEALEYDVTGVEFSKNRFSNSYVHVPVGFQFRTNENDRGKRFYFVLSPEVSFLLNGKVKQISKEDGKQKFRDDYTFQRIRYGGTLRLGYGGLGIFTRYYFNDMFDSPQQEKLKNMSFGVTFGIN